MGSGSEEDSITKKQNSKKNQLKDKLKIILLIIATNLVTIYIFTSPHFNNFQHPIISRLVQPQETSSSATTSLLLKIDSTEQELTQSRTQITGLRSQLKSTHSLVDHLLAELARLNSAIDQANSEPKASRFDDLLETLSEEARLSFGPHELPLGYTPQIGSDSIYSSVGEACLKYREDLDKYMSYDIGQECPLDDVFAQHLMLKGCEPLPRRRCHPKSPSVYVEPTPLPESLWATPSDKSLIWDPYTCKNYDCLKERRNKPGSYDCKDCFFLEGREKSRWLHDNGGLDFSIDSVLATKSKGSIRIGLDLGGGSGSFAARMRERNITIVTTSMNFDGPFNSFISSRGLISMHVTISQRFPFFENTLDIVHSMHVLSNWIPDMMLEFILYDIYRVLRPGGLFWLDRFFCFGSQLNATYVPMFDRVGFKRLRWNTGMKLDKGIEKNEWYFSALLEKPTS